MFNILKENSDIDWQLASSSLTNLQNLQNSLKKNEKKMHITKLISPSLTKLASINILNSQRIFISRIKIQN